MPELPEVQTIVDDLKKKIVGLEITHVWFDWERHIKNITPSNFKNNIKDIGAKLAYMRKVDAKTRIEVNAEKILVNSLLYSSEMSPKTFPYLFSFKIIHIF